MKKTVVKLSLAASFAFAMGFATFQGNLTPDRSGEATLASLSLLRSAQAACESDPGCPGGGSKMCIVNCSSWSRKPWW